MVYIKSQSENLLSLDLSAPADPASKEVVTLEECQQHLARFELDDERILEIRNNLVGIVDRIVSAYLRDYR